MASIAGASAADVGTAQSQAVNNSTVQENAGIHTNNTYNENESVATQNSTDKNVTEDTSTATSNASTNQTTVKTEPVAQDIANTSADQNATTSTVTSTNSTSKNSTDTETNTQNAASAAVNKSQNSTSTKTNTENNTTSTQTQGVWYSTIKDSASTPSAGHNTIKNNDSYQKAAAGETKVISKRFTVKQINNAAARVKAYIETNHKLPSYVTIGTTQVQMSDFLRLLVANLLQLNNKKTSSITLKSVSSPAKPSESIKSGNINKAGYLDLAKRVNAFINANGILPNYATSSLGKLNYKSLIYTFSKVLAFYNTNSRLPNYVTVKPWSKVGSSSTSTSGSTSTPIPASLQQYLKATKNCQVTNSQIQALTKSITSGKSSTYAKASAIFNWVRDNIGYSFYYNSEKGAVGTLNAKTGNCVDTSHLLIALERAAGIPARYEHGYCKFSKKWYGHVWTQVYVDGKWYRADAISYSNTFGVIKNWNTTTATIYGTYTSLPW